MSTNFFSVLKPYLIMIDNLVVSSFIITRSDLCALFDLGIRIPMKGITISNLLGYNICRYGFATGHLLMFTFNKMKKKHSYNEYRGTYNAIKL